MNQVPITLILKMIIVAFLRKTWSLNAVQLSFLVICLLLIFVGGAKQRSHDCILHLHCLPFLRYVGNVMVQDLQTEEKWHFLCNSWLSVDIDDCSLDKIFPAASEMDLKRFR